MNVGVTVVSNVAFARVNTTGVAPAVVKKAPAAVSTNFAGLIALPVLLDCATMTGLTEKLLLETVALTTVRGPTNNAGATVVATRLTLPVRTSADDGHTIG